MISNNYVPEKINDANIYLNGNKMIGVAPTVKIPEVVQKTSELSGMGIAGTIDSPTIGLFDSLEQELQFNALYSSFQDMLDPIGTIDITIRAAQQVYDKNGGYDFKGLRIVERGRIKKYDPGKVEKGEGMECKMTIELTYIMIENDGVKLVEIDKLNSVYVVNGVNILEKISTLT